MKQTLSCLLAVLAAALVLEWTRPAHACGPWFFPPVFTEILHPDLPVLPYTQGELGVVQPTYNRIYLYVAYRNLVGPGFSAEEARALWADRPGLLGEAAAPPVSGPPRAQPEPTNWLQAWRDGRNHVVNTGPPEYIPRWWSWPYLVRAEQGPNGRYTNYFNCPPQAFQTAVETLRDRSQKYGAGSPELVAWVKAQDQVFSNCQKGENIPAPLAADASPLARADRQYQIAAAYFYAGDFAKAVTAFGEVAGDHASPWSPIANYLVARAYIRQATVGHDDSSPDPGALVNAEAQLQQVLADPRLPELHASAAALLDYVEVRLHPEQRVCELGRALMQRPVTSDVTQKARDYTFLLDKLENEQFSPGSQQLQRNREINYPKLADLRARDDLTDWILTFQLASGAALDHAYEKWEQTRSAAWLVAAITKIQPDDGRAAELLAAARSVPPSAPAYASVTFHRFRLIAQSGRCAAVLPELNRLLSRGDQSLPRSAMNLFLALRMRCAQNLTDFLKYAQRVPGELSYNGYGGPEYALSHPPAGSPWFDSDALIVLNQQMPLSVLTEAAQSNVLPGYLRRQIALGAWTRAFLIGNNHAALKLAPVLGGLAPELRPDLKDFTNAPTPEARRFAGILLILRLPGLWPYITSPERDTPINLIDELRENWWGKGSPCGLFWGELGWTICEEYGEQPGKAGWPLLRTPLPMIYPRGEVSPPSFLTRAQLTQAQKEWAQTQVLPVAPILLGSDALSWVRKHPDDRRAAEALALVVRAGHLGCPDENRWKVSKAAFELLHRRYPSSTWAKRTRYWYR